MSLPKLVISDIDGVWTDGGMYYGSDGVEWKKFNTSDSAGVLFLRYFNVPLAIFTGENTPIVANRAAKLGIERLYQGVKNKLALAEQVCSEMGISLSDIAYLGDDLNDMELLEAAGLSACPAQSPDYIRSRCVLRLSKAGGEGVFREFVEHILRENDLLEKALELYLKRRDLKQ
jgi:3-deoxy-D-manno-octulosonate 8-phosphate phosphatase (KDO 8-P phosphatase)